MSALHDALTDYLAARRALGTQHRWPASALRGFVDFVEREGADFVTIEIALTWAAKPVGVKDATRARRLGIVRGFATWLSATHPRTQVPPRGLLSAGQRRPAPYIFSAEEIADLMSAALSLRSASGMRCWTHATHIGLLSATGLRPGEVLALNLADVDHSTGILTVLNSQFGRSRLVPLDESTSAALAHYAEHRDKIHPRRDTAAFFVSERGTRLKPHATRRTFARLCQAIGLRAPTEPRRIGRGPRLQDIRHTFATRRLIEWYRAGHDVQRLMPRLSSYLGHVRVTDTYWYIQAVPELLQLATERMEMAIDRGGR